jgi:hypothetical protein
MTSTEQGDGSTTRSPTVTRTSSFTSPTPGNSWWTTPPRCREPGCLMWARGGRPRRTRPGLRRHRHRRVPTHGRAAGLGLPRDPARQMDAGRLDFTDGSFDLVTAGFVVQVLDDPAAAIAEIRRVLAPAGMFALSLERQSVGRLRWLHELNAEFFQNSTPDNTTVDQDAGPLTDQELVTLLVEAGFVDLARQRQSPVGRAAPPAVECAGLPAVFDPAFSPPNGVPGGAPA